MSVTKHTHVGARKQGKKEKKNPRKVQYEPNYSTELKRDSPLKIKNKNCKLKHLNSI